MADKFKKIMTEKCGGVGGLHCTCCNIFKGKEKPKLRRIARRIIKRQDKKENNET